MAEGQLRQNLIKACEQGLDPSKIVPLCDRLLHANKSDPLGLRCKIIALLQSKRASQAAAVARELAGLTNNKKASSSGRFLLAMCLYRDNKFSEAEDALTDSGKLDKSTFGAKELNLLAQSRYNQFQYREAAEIYERLLEKELYQDDVERDEILTNLSACYASVAEVEKCLATSRRAGEENHYDLLFNYATALAQRGRFREASTVLSDAERICIYSNDYQPEKIDFCAKEHSKDALDTSSEDSSKKKFAAFIKDVVSIKVQQAFVAFHLNDRETAEKILKAILHTHSHILIGTVAHAAASLNWTALKRHSDFLDSYKRLKHIQQPLFAKRLTAEQRECAAYNAFLLALGVGKQAEARSMAESLIRDFPGGTLGPRALASVVASSDPKRAETVLKKVFSSQQQTATTSIHQTLTMAQLTLARGDALGALDLTSQSEEAMSQPAVVTTVLAGYASLLSSSAKQQAAAAEKALKDILASKSVSQLLSSNADFAYQVAFNVHARSGRHAEAAALLEKAASSSTSNTVTISKDQKRKLIAAAILEFIKARDITNANRVAALPDSPIDFSKSTSTKFTLAQTESTALPRDKLTKAGFAKPTTTSSSGTTTTTGTSSNNNNNNNNKQKAGLVTAIVETEARKRPGRRLPKDLDKTKKIDPERWIPWSMRTYVKDMPPRRRIEAKKRRADEQAEIRRAAERRKKEAASAAASASSTSATSTAAPPS